MGSQSRGRRTAWKRPRAVLLVAVFAAFSVLSSAASASESVDVVVVRPLEGPFQEEWSLALSDLGAGFADGTAWTALAASSDGTTLVGGTDNGVVAFLSAGRRRPTSPVVFQSKDHGEVEHIQVTREGGRAVIRYADGLLEVLDQKALTPLWRRFQDGAPPDLAGRATAILREDGRFLFVAERTVEVYFDDPEAGFRKIGRSMPGERGPFIYSHPAQPVFAAMDGQGKGEVFTYTSQDLRSAGELPLDLYREDEPEDVARITTTAVAEDGSRLAVGYNDGLVVRFRIDIENVTNALLQGRPPPPMLVPEYEGRLVAAVSGIALSIDGRRIVAWSGGVDKGDTLVWARGRNRNVETSDAVTVPLALPDITQLAASSDLYRILVRTGEGTTAYNMPDARSAGSRASGSGDEPALLDGDGDTAYLTMGTRIGRFFISDEALPEPPARSDPDLAPPATKSDGQGLLGALGGAPFLWLGIGAAALVLLPLLVVGLLRLARPATRRGAETDDEDLSGALAPALVLGTRRPTASAPLQAAPPDGPLVLEGFVAESPGARLELDLHLTRPVVVRLAGTAAELRLLHEVLAKARPFRGVLAAGGVSARETRTLFDRRVQNGLPTIDGGRTAAVLVTDEADRHGLPQGVRARRVASDLAWMDGARQNTAAAHLSPLDRWKLRIVVALVRRPDILVITPDDLLRPPADHATRDRMRAAIGRVLRGVARHYGVLLLVLDDGTWDAAEARTWADEEVVLEHGRVGRRALLKDGRPLKKGDATVTAAPPKDKRRRRRT